MQPQPGQRVFFISDTHFNHARILEFCPNRPGHTLEGMNYKLIENWNARVGSEDIVFHLGDFAMGPRSKHKDFLSQLNGTKILIRGNHDPSATKCYANGWDAVYLSLELTLDGHRIYMSHIPQGNDSYEGRSYDPQFLPKVPDAGSYDYWLCGHVHNAWRRAPKNDKVINVGVDVNNYEPKTLGELLSD